VLKRQLDELALQRHSLLTVLERLRESEINARRVSQEAVRARADVATRRASLRHLRVAEANVSGRLGKLRSEQALLTSGLGLLQQQSGEMVSHLESTVAHAEGQMTAARELLRHGRVRAEDVERDHRVLLRERKDLLADLDLLRVEEEKEFLSLAARANIANQEVVGAGASLAQSVAEAEDLRAHATQLHARVHATVDAVDRTTRDAKDTADAWGRVVVSGRQNVHGGVKDIAEADARSNKVAYDDFTLECAELSQRMSRMSQDFQGLNERLDPVEQRISKVSGGD